MALNFFDNIFRLLGKYRIEDIEINLILKGIRNSVKVCFYGKNVITLYKNKSAQTRNFPMKMIILFFYILCEQYIVYIPYTYLTFKSVYI